MRCTFGSGGSLDTVSWSAPDGSPASGSENTFETRFDKPGEASISLEVCKRNSCTTAVSHFEIWSSPSGWIPPAECAKDGPTTLSASPIDPAVLTSITPLGRMSTKHVTPTNHISLRFEQPRTYPPTYDIVAPADGQIVRISTQNLRPAPAGQPGFIMEYLLVIWHSCTLSTTLWDLGGLPPAILEVTGDLPADSSWYPSRDTPPIQVQAGQVIGRVSPDQTVMDFAVQDTDIVLSGFVMPSRYDGEPWKIHTVDPFDYFEEPVRSRLLENVLRTAEPRGGKIDYDIDGRLVGNWFLDGTVGYGSRIDRLAIAYDHIDPTQIRISMVAGIQPEEDGVATVMKFLRSGVTPRTLPLSP